MLLGILHILKHSLSIGSRLRSPRQWVFQGQPGPGIQIWGAGWSGRQCNDAVGFVVVPGLAGALFSFPWSWLCGANCTEALALPYFPRAEGC